MWHATALYTTGFNMLTGSVQRVASFSLLPCVEPPPPITESLGAVTSHWHARERSSHNKPLLNNRLDRNNS